jgi:hypothetical protein
MCLLFFWVFHEINFTATDEIKLLQERYDITHLLYKLLLNECEYAHTSLTLILYMEV